MSTPEQPSQAVQQLSAGLVDTPDGQRLALTVTLLMDAGQAKAFAAGITVLAESMSASGLVVANGVVR